MTAASDKKPPDPNATEGGVDGIVRDIRDGILQMSSRELDVRRREQEVEREYRDLKRLADQDVARENQEAKARMARRAMELNSRARELEARRQALNTLLEDLKGREENLGRQRAEVDSQVEAARRLDESAQERERRQRDTLRSRIGVLRKREQELHKRIELARDDAVRRREELDRGREALDQQAANVAASERALEERREELEQRLAEGAKLTVEVERHGEVLRDEWGQVEAERGRLNELASKLEAEKAALKAEREQVESSNRLLLGERDLLADKRGKLDDRWQATRQQRHELTRRAEELDASRHALENKQRAHQEQVQGLCEREERAREQARDLAEREEGLAEIEAELAERGKAVQEQLQEAEERKLQSDARHDEVLALRDQAEAQEAEARQLALALEIQRQTLDGEQEAVEKARAVLESLHRDRETEFDGIRAALDERAQEVRAAEESVLAAPRLWWLRGSGLALVVAVAVAAGWLGLNPASYRATLDMDIESAGTNTGRVVAEHQRGLLSADWLAGDDARGDEAEASLAAQWRQACAAGRVTAVPVADRAALRLSVSAASRAAAEELLRKTVEAYARGVNGRPGDDTLPPYYQDLVKRRGELGAALLAAREQHAQDEAALADLPGAEVRQLALVAAEEIDQRRATVAKELADRRAELALQVATAAPRGKIASGAAEQMLEDDAIYQEDQREFWTVALQYRSELATAMLALDQPAQTVADALMEFAGVLDEQQGMNPPESVSVVIEECAADLATARERLAAFNAEWAEWTEGVQAVDVRTDVVELVRLQNTVATAAGRLADQTGELVRQVGARIEKFSAAGTGGTREVVVGAVLRGEHLALESAVEPLRVAAVKTAQTDNYELDAHDRKLRGLRMRLTNRQRAVTERLQVEADRAAADQHAAQVAELRGLTRELEGERERLVDAAAAKLVELRESDQAASQRDALRVRVEEVARQTAWLEERCGEVDAALIDARREGPEPDRVLVGETTSTTATPDRYRDAGLAAAGGFAITWLACLMMIVRIPQGRRRE